MLSPKKFKSIHLRFGILHAVWTLYSYSTASKQYLLGRSKPHLIVGDACDDGYDGLSYKVAYGIREITARFSPNYLIKVDDDFIVSDTELVEKLGEIRKVCEMKYNNTDELLSHNLCMISNFTGV